MAIFKQELLQSFVHLLSNSISNTIQPASQPLRPLSFQPAPTTATATALSTNVHSSEIMGTTRKPPSSSHKPSPSPRPESLAVSEQSNSTETSAPSLPCRIKLLWSDIMPTLVDLAIRSFLSS